MDSTDRMDTTAWIDARLQRLAPPDDWEPAVGVALARLHQRVDAAADAEARGARAAMRGLWSRWRAGRWLAAAAVASLLVVALPAARAAAQQIWYLWIGRVEVIRLDVDRLPASLEARLRAIPDVQRHLPTAARAAEQAGFAPRLPDASAGLPAPDLSVASPMSFDATVNRADLLRALQAAGLGDASVPPAWDGARLSLHVSHLIVAEYPGIQLAQVRPLAISTPDGFDFAAFAGLLLRLGGLDRDAARTLSGQTGALGLLAVRRDASVTIRELRLDAGPATLVRDLDNAGVEGRATLLWSADDRLFLLEANMPDARLIAIANAVH